MQRLLKVWEGSTYWSSAAGRRLIEYLLIGTYSAVAILSFIVGLTAKAGTFFGRAAEDTSFAGRPEFRSILKQLMLATADFGAGISLLIVAAAIVYWERRRNAGQRRVLRAEMPSGPPFLF
jgi:hypothetical protein